MLMKRSLVQVTLLSSDSFIDCINSSMHEINNALYLGHQNRQTKKIQTCHEIIKYFYFNY